MMVSAVPVCSIEGMIPQHVLRLFRHIPACCLIDVFVVSKREVHLIEPAVRLVNAILGLVRRNLAIGVGGKEFRENHLVGILAPDRERVAYYCPLWLAI